jgi:hypothetical protein
MNSSKKITKITETHLTDISTGEVLSKAEQQTYRIPQEPAYVKFYLEDIGHIHGLTKAESDVLFCLSRLIGWDGIVSISKTRFEKSIQPLIGIKHQTFKNTISKLVSKGIFTRAGRGELEANPFLFAKGEWSEVYKRRKEIKLEITYDDTGRRIFSEIK